MKRATLFVMAFLYFIGCKHYDNFTTYFNTYYNSQRLMKEAEDEFEYQEQKLKAQPKIVYPETKIQVANNIQQGPPPFMQEFIISQRQLQPVKIKLDSIIIKGSKILAYHSKSSFVEGSIFLMAKSYFYKNEWLPSQIKCSELIDKFPDGDLSPDAHLLFAENLLIQKKFYSGKIILSRTIDIAWQKGRYDILSEAFRLQAELALYEGDVEGAIRPYKQAIAQSDDNELNARWQFDLASIYYRLGQFDKALENYKKVRSFSPDYLSTFSSYYYEALCLIRLAKFDDGEKILEKLKEDSKWAEWKEYTYSGFMLSSLLKNDSTSFLKLEKYTDSAFKTTPPITIVYYEKGLIEYNKGNYNEARKYFARARNMKTPVTYASERMFNLLNNWEQKYRFTEPLLTRFNKGEEIGDTMRLFLSANLYELGRTFEQLGFKDSSLYYYKLAYEISPQNDTNTARYLYSYARIAAENNLFISDSLKDLLIDKYPRTEYGKEVLKEFGYTHYFLIDSTAETYLSGLQLLKNKEYSLGLEQLKRVYQLSPNHPLAPKSLYRVGVAYERELKQYDSAFVYYKKLLDEYPKSEYAKDVQLSVTYYLAVQSGQPIPDSLQTPVLPQRQLPPIKGYEILPQQNQLPEIDKQGQGDGNQFNPLDYFKDPSKIIKDAKNLFHPENLTPKVELPKNPLEEFKPKVDSSNTPKPDIEKLEPKK